MQNLTSVIIINREYRQKVDFRIQDGQEELKIQVVVVQVPIMVRIIIFNLYILWNFSCCLIKGTGIDPNYGVVKPSRNQPGHNINVIRYGHNSIPGAEHNRNWNQQLRQHYYLYNNNYNNPWQRPNFNNYYNRYPPGSQGWYATGGNYWYNKGQLIIPDVWLLIAGTLASIICTWIINKVLLI